MDCEDTKTTELDMLKRVNFMICELYLNFKMFNKKEKEKEASTSWAFLQS